MSSMEELTFFLGLQVEQRKDGIFLSQDKYVYDILKKFGFTTVKTASTPMETHKSLSTNVAELDVDVHLYRSMIGTLMYITSSRPDIMFAVCACSRFQVTPKVSHMHAVKRIFRYLKGKPTLGLWYPKDSPMDLIAYLDSDYAGESIDRKSTTRGCQFLGSVSTAVYIWIGVNARSFLCREEFDGRVFLQSLASPKQTAIGKDFPNLFMAGSLPKTIKQSNDPPFSRGYTLGSGKDSLELIELMAHYTQIICFVRKKNREI
ncbi:hypothetical protein Tco_1224629, partial [Tanacetum coccineum]